MKFFFFPNSVQLDSTACEVC